MSKKFLSPIKLAQGTSNPASGSAGEIFYNTTDKTIYTHNGTGWGTAESSLPAGTMVQWAGASAPANWLLCDGTAVSRTTYATLFAAIGTAYGTGDGSTTFNLPDLRGRVPVGKNGGSFGTLGATGGAETVTLTEAQMPSHTHIQNSHNHTQDAHSHAIYGSNGGSAGVSISITSNSNGDRAWYLPGSIAANTTATNQAATATNQNTGGGQAHNNLQPYQVVNYIIKATSGTTAGDSPLTSRVSTLETNVRSVTLGGTGANTLTSGGYLKGNGTSAITSQSGIPATDITSGSLAIANGGTGATTGSGLVPIIPSSVAIGSGSVSVNSAGVISFSGVSYLNPRGIFTSAYKDYVIRVTSSAASANYVLGYFTLANGNNLSSAYYSGSFYRQVSGTGIFASDNAGTNGYFTCGYMNNDNASQFTFTITDPINKTFSCDFLSSYATTSHTNVWGGMGYNGNAAVDGFMFYMSSNVLMTGRMQVFGYRNS